jgi:hypothetical protein
MCAVATMGCVRRRLFVASNPAGALVYVDNEQIGTTPCAVDFTYYGTREIRLVKPGFETLTVNQPIPTPWYELPPLDFVTENMVPYKVRDNRAVTYNLSPQLIVPSDQLIARGEQLRQETLQGTVLPASATMPVVPGGLPPGAVPTGPLVPTGPQGVPYQSPTFAPPPLGTSPLRTSPLGTSPLRTSPGVGTPPPLVLPAPPGPLPQSLVVPLPPSTQFTPTPNPQRGWPLVSPPLR